jgi:ribosomal subunit interface protein
MDIIVESKTIPVTAALRALAVKQARRLVRLGGRILRVRIHLDAITKKKNDTQSSVVQFQVELPGKDIIVRRHARDLYLALVEAAHQASRQVRKAKERRLTLKRHHRLIPDEAWVTPDIT